MCNEDLCLEFIPIHCLRYSGSLARDRKMGGQGTIVRETERQREMERLIDIDKEENGQRENGEDGEKERQDKEGEKGQDTI